MQILNNLAFFDLAYYKLPKICVLGVFWPDNLVVLLTSRFRNKPPPKHTIAVNTLNVFLYYRRSNLHIISICFDMTVSGFTDIISFLTTAVLYEEKNPNHLNCQCPNMSWMERGLCHGSGSSLFSESHCFILSLPLNTWIQIRHFTCVRFIHL